MNIGIIVKAGLKTSLRLRSVAAGSAGVAIICAAGVAVVFATQFIRPEMQTPVPDLRALENFLGLVLFTTSFISIAIFASVNAFHSLTRDKSKGNIQALLATPLSPGEIWLGRSLAVFIPGLLFAFVLTTATYLVLNFIYFVPNTGFLFSPWALVSSLVAVPLIYLALMLLVHQIGLSSKPGTANIIAHVFLLIIIILMINLVIRDVLDRKSVV